MRLEYQGELFKIKKCTKDDFMIALPLYRYYVIINNKNLFIKDFD